MPRRARRPRLRPTRDHPTTLAISTMIDEHLICRDFGHSWRPWAAEWIPQRRQYAEALVCSRCNSVRHRLLDEFGALLGNSYTYAEGYLVHGLGRLTGDDRNDLRLASLRAVMDATGGRQEEPPGRPLSVVPDRRAAG
jgi:hypothetical protein